MNSCDFGATSIETQKEPTTIWGHGYTDPKDPSSPVISKHGDNPVALSPAGTIHCSIKDWIKYLKIHAKPDGSNLLSLKSLEKLHQLYPAQKSSYTYGGWVRAHRQWAKGYALHHTGTNTFNFANVWLAPKRNTFFLAFINSFTLTSGKAADELIGALIQATK